MKKTCKKLTGYTLTQLKKLCITELGRLPKMGYCYQNLVILPDNTRIDLYNISGKIEARLYKPV